MEFNKKLKAQIKKRDEYRCQECFKHQSEIKQPLCVHHIDFNKKNNNPKNLITLCDSCHGQTQFDRKQWINYYEGVQNGRINL